MLQVNPIADALSIPFEVGQLVQREKETFGIRPGVHHLSKPPIQSSYRGFGIQIDMPWAVCACA